MPSNRLFCFIDWIYAEPDELVPKKGLEPCDLASAFRFNKIPLSTEYTNLSLFSIPPTNSTLSTP